MPSRPWLHNSLINNSRKPSPHTTSPHSKRPPPKGLIIAVTLTGVGIVVVLLLILLLWLHHRRRLSCPRQEEGRARKLRRYSYRELKNATDKFSEVRRLGKGGFGVVYRGVLRNGQQVAVKKLVLSSLQGEREFQNELSICRRLDSRYVVKLLGFSSHGEKVRLLVYECMQNRSLQEALLEKKDCAQCLDWATRYSIIVDIAKALAYLHLECDPPVIHGDVKPSNVLLDGKFSAYIADFGLARVKISKDATSTAAAGGRQGTPDASERFRSDADHSLQLPETPDSLRGGKSKSFDTDVVENGGCNRELKHIKKMNAVVGCADQRATAIQSSVEAESSLPSSYIGSPHSAIRWSAAEVAYVETEPPSVALSSNAAVQNHDQHADGTLLQQQQQQQEIEAQRAKKGVMEKKVSGKDWWWKQENSGELKVRDYVMEWMRSELAMSTDAKKEKEKEKEKQQEDEEEGRRKRKKEREAQRKRKTREEEVKQEARRKERAKGRKSREWWKDEYFAELSEKSRKGGRRLAEAAVAPPQRLFLNGVLASGSERRGWGQECTEAAGASDDLSHEVSSTTSMRGTVCYVAPESGGGAGIDAVSEASDIYSFGVLLLVIISGRRPIDITTASAHLATTSASPPTRRFERGNLITWARTLAYSGNVLELVDERLVDYAREQVQLCINVALLCIQRVPSRRPTITALLKALEGDAPPPSLPLEFSPSPPSRNISYHHSPLRASSLVSSDDFA